MLLKHSLARPWVAFSLTLGGGLTFATGGGAQPNVPKPAPVPPRIVPGGTNPTPERIKPNTGPQKVEITPPTAIQNPVAPSPFKMPDDARIDPATLHQKPVTNRFVMALCADKTGGIWIGTEDEGVWRYDEKAPETKRWKQFTTKDGLGDNNAYAIACDQQGRLWIGHLNHGVSVYNGQVWKNYDVLDGPLGERIFDIAVAPNDGSVWMATSAGLTRYSSQKDDWSYFTRAEGLPSDQIAALAFNAKGDLFAGTQCDGLAIARAGDEYKVWQSVRGPETMPNTPLGKGLPSNLINDVLITKDQSIYVATTCGLTRSFDNGATWDYIRGADWEARVKGLYKGPQPKPLALSGELLTEDYSTCLAEDAKGQVYVGHWRRGYEVRNAKSNRRISYNSEPDFVTALLPSTKSFFLGFYGGGMRSLTADKMDTDFQLPIISVTKPIPIQPAQTGLQKITDIDVPPIEQPTNVRGQDDSANTVVVTSPKPPNFVHPVLPSVARPLTAERLEQLHIQLQKQTTETFTNQKAAWGGDDWRTLGDWVGRYGRQRTVLCAVNSPFDHDFSRGLNYQTVIGQIGPQHAGGDSLRYWVHWLKSDDPRVLYDPILGYRRQAEWDDHGETYPATTEGPDLWVMMQIPDGAHKLSFYFFNKDGHTDKNRYRDYLLELRTVNEALPEWPTDPPPGPNHDKEFVGRFDTFWKTWWQKIARAEEQPVLARSRVRDFWGSVYKSFQVQGPGRFWLKVARNGSHNTILSSVMIDKLSGLSDGFEQKPMSWMGGVPDNPPDPNAIEPPDPHLLDKILAGQNVGNGASKLNAEEEKIISSARALWIALESENALSPNWQWQGRLAAYRAVSAIAQTRSTVLVEGRALKLPILLARWRWQMDLWTNTDREDFRHRMTFAYKRLLELNPQMKGEF